MWKSEFNIMLFLEEFFTLLLKAEKGDLFDVVTLGRETKTSDDAPKPILGVPT